MTPTLLIVEDDQNIRRFVTANLKARGYKTLQAESAEDGLQQLYQHKPEALILDIKLPGMNGWNMLKIIADDPELPKIPVVVMSASVMSDQSDEVAYTNVITRLVKPISVDELIQAVNRMLGPVN